MNYIALTGRLARDPEVRYTPDSLAIANYSLAVDRIGQKDKADFFNCTAFGKGAEFVGKYLRKGTKVLIEGSLQTDEWTAKDGTKRTGVKVIANRHEFCEKKEDRDQTPDPKEPGEFMDLPADEELPFNF